MPFLASDWALKQYQDCSFGSLVSTKNVEFIKTMLIHITRILLIAAIALPALSLCVMAQNSQTKRQLKTQKIREKIAKLGVGEAVRIRVELENRTTYRGYLKEAGEEDFVIIDKQGTANSVRYSDVDRIGGKNLSTGAKIAIGIGIGVGGTILAIYLLYLAAGGS